MTRKKIEKDEDIKQGAKELAKHESEAAKSDVGR